MVNAEGHGKMLFDCFIPGRPGIKKNSRRIVGTRGRRPRLLTSTAYQQWAKEARLLLRHAMRRHEINEPLTQDLFMLVTVRYKDKRVSDLSNCLEGIQDEMQAVGVIGNDRQIRSIYAMRMDSSPELVGLRVMLIESA